MAVNYRDYGKTIYGDTGTVVDGATLTPINTKRQTQVYQATHRGDNRLPYMNRSFISFTYGGRDIEDFNLIATTNGDRMSREAYASFEDTTTTYSALDGQFYWGTHFRNNSITFHLATDGMTQRQLDDFKNWFVAGKTKELILAEHPNRAIMARVSSQPHFALLGFEEPIGVILNGASYKTSTTIYRGEIDLDMTMDEPYWYAKINIFGGKDPETGIYKDVWYDVSTGTTRTILDNPDAIKILYEDGIPFSSMIQNTMLLGENIFASVNYQLISRVVNGITSSEYASNAGVEGYFNNGNGRDDIRIIDSAGIDRGQSDYYKGATIAYMDGANQDHYIRGARIAGAIMNDQDGITFLPSFGQSQSSVNFYYAGTAPSPTILSFDLIPQMDICYICTPSNNYATTIEKDGKLIPYNTITIEGKDELKEFHLTTPNIYTSYNQVIRIFDNPDIIKQNLSWASVRELIRETVWHPEIRAWANRAIDVYDDEDGQGIIDQNSAEDHTASIRGILKVLMSYIFRDTNNVSLLPAHYSFNAKTGESFGEIQHRSCLLPSGAVIMYDKSGDTITEGYLTDYEPGRNWGSYCVDNIKTSKENVGDMVKSKYLFIEERNYPNQDNEIVEWSSGKDYSHRLYHDFPDGISNVYIDYQNLYL